MTRGEGLAKLFSTVIITGAHRKIQTNKHSNFQQGLSSPTPRPLLRQEKNAPNFADYLVTRNERPLIVE